MGFHIPAKGILSFLRGHFYIMSVTGALNGCVKVFFCPSSASGRNFDPQKIDVFPRLKFQSSLNADKRDIVQVASK